MFLLKVIVTFLNLYMILLIVRCLLTWFPNVNWLNQIGATLGPITDPYLNLFRSFIPPLGGTLDLSPMVAILLLQFLTGMLANLQIDQSLGIY